MSVIPFPTVRPLKRLATSIDLLEAVQPALGEAARRCPMDALVIATRDATASLPFSDLPTPLVYLFRKNDIDLSVAREGRRWLVLLRSVPRGGVRSLRACDVDGFGYVDGLGQVQRSARDGS